MKTFTKNLLRNSIVAALAVGTLASVQPASALGKKPPAAPDTTFKPGLNLITNASHEGPGVFFDGRGELFVSWNWVPFWTEPPAGANLRDQRFRTPEFRMADGSIEVFRDRVKSGRLSNHGFNYFAANPAAGFMQNVKNLKPGSPVRFTTWLLLWTSNVPNLIPPKSVEPGNLEARVCIDQDGGPRDMTDPNLVCSAWSRKYDEWHQLSVDGVAKSDTVNAFLWSRSSEFVEHNDYYMDDSCFEVLSKATDKGICKGAGFVNDGRLEVLDWYQKNTN